MLYMTGLSPRYLLLLFILSGWSLFFAGDCSRRKPAPRLERLEMIRKHKLAIEEPSGLTFTSSNNALLTVSDKTNNIYKISLTGGVQKTFPYTGYDVEGITSAGKTSGMWIVEERVRDVVYLNNRGDVVYQFHVDIAKHRDNVGLEGIAYNPSNEHLYLLNEQNPGLLIETDLSGNILRKNKLNFANDYAGIFYEKKDNCLWIVSDESRSVSCCTLDGKLIKGYSINVIKPEGIAVNPVTKEIYIVSDATGELYVFRYY